MEVDKLIEDANELLMKLRVKSEKETINEKQLYEVQMLLYKALDKLRQQMLVVRCRLYRKLKHRFTNAQRLLWKAMG